MKRAFRYFLISILSIIFTLIAVGIIYIVADTHSRIKLQDNKETYSSEEVEELVSEAKEEGRNSVLDSIKESLENGNAIISVLKSLYPEYIVVAANSKYNFVEINQDLSKNNFDIDNLSEDELGRYVYKTDGELTSRFGIDVSSHQGDIDWNAAREDGVEFAMLRIGVRGYAEDGILKADEMFAKNFDEARDAGIDLGVYFYSQAVSAEEAEEEARFVLQLLDGRTLEYPVVFDWENVDTGSTDIIPRTEDVMPQTLTLSAISFCETVKEAGYDTMIYTNKKLAYLKYDMRQLQNYPIWLALYSKELTYYYDFDIWQYGTGTVEGIDGEVDYNIAIIK